MFSVLSKFAQTVNDFQMDFDSFETTTTTESAAGAAAGLGAMLVFLVIGLLVYLFFSFCLMKIFKKAGRQDSWAAFIPIYNMYVYYEVAGRPGWWAFLGLIPIVGGLIAIITGIIGSIDLAKSFGKGAGFGILLAFLPVIGFPVLAFSDAQYQGPAGPEGQGGQMPPQPPVQQPPVQQPPVQQQPPASPQPPVVQ